MDETWTATLQRRALASEPILWGLNVPSADEPPGYFKIANQTNPRKNPFSTIEGAFCRAGHNVVKDYGKNGAPTLTAFGGGLQPINIASISHKLRFDLYLDHNESAPAQSYTVTKDTARATRVIDTLHKSRSGNLP